MTLLVNSFDGGTAGSPVAAVGSGGVSGSAFDSVSTTASGVNNYDATHVAHGGLANLIQCTSAVASNGQNIWSSSMGSKTQVWGRLYQYWTAIPTSGTERIWKATSSGALASSVGINASGHIVVTNAAGTAVLTSAAVIPLNAWWRVEFMIKLSATTGQVEFKLFTTNMDAAAPDETQTSAATAVLTAAADAYVYGLQSNALVTSWWQDDVALSDTAYVGPVQLTTAAPLVVPQAAVVQAATW